MSCCIIVITTKSNDVACSAQGPRVTENEQTLSEQIKVLGGEQTSAHSTASVGGGNIRLNENPMSEIENIKFDVLMKYLNISLGKRKVNYIRLQDLLILHNCI